MPIKNSNSNKISLFLASSEELKEDRRAFEILVSRLNTKWHAERGIFLDLQIWEIAPENLQLVRSQELYNESVRQAGIFVMLLHNRLGMYTQEEFEIAKERFLKTRKPHIYIYYKESEASEEHLLQFLQQFAVSGKEYFYRKYNVFTEIELSVSHAIENYASIFLPEENAYTRNKLIKGLAARYERSLQKKLNNELFFELELELQYTREGTEDIFVNNYFIERYADLDQSDFDGLFTKFTDEIRKLIILGEPGAGKTVLLLQFARRLISLAARDPAYPVPVMLNLASWTGDYPYFEEWLADVLTDAGGESGISKAYAKTLADERRLLLLLDGLDEIPEKHRDICLEKLNDYLYSIERAMPLDGKFPVAIICSRKTEYVQMKSNAPVRGAVVIKSLEERKITDWLTAAREDKEAAGILLRNIRQQPSLLNHLKTAFQMYLTLHLAHKLDFQQINDQVLIDKYITAEMEKTDLAKPVMAVKYLTFLAAIVHAGRKSVSFELADLQIYLVKHRTLLNLFNGLIWGTLCTLYNFLVKAEGVTNRELGLFPLATAVVFAVVGKLPVLNISIMQKPFAWYRKRLLKRLTIGLLLGIVVYFTTTQYTKWEYQDILSLSVFTGLIPASLDYLLIAGRFLLSKFYLASQIVNRPVEVQEIRFFKFAFNRPLFKKGFLDGFNFSVITGLCVSFIMVPVILLTDQQHEFESKYLNGAFTWLILAIVFILPFIGYGLVLGLIRGTVNSLFPIKPIPSLQNPYIRFYAQFLFDFLQTTLTIATLAIPVVMIKTPDSYLLFLLHGLIGSFILTFLLSPLYRHSLLRVFLYLEQRLPLRLRHFLDKIASTGLMERDGGQWRFRHQLIQDRFANKKSD
jgi:hypothetical protein